MKIDSFILYQYGNDNKIKLMNEKNSIIYSDTTALVNVSNSMTLFYEILSESLPKQCLSESTDCTRLFV